MRRWLIVGALGLTSTLLAACMGEPIVSIPEDGQRVRVSSDNDVIRIAPNSIEAGDVWFVFEPDPVTQHVDVVFVHRGSPDEPPEPLSEEDIEMLRADATPDVPGFAYDTSFGAVAPFTLEPGLYAFLLPPGGEGQPESDEPPISLAVLEVRP
jgi:hypothetical protein